MKCETDLEDFIDFLHDHHSDKDPIFPDLLWTNDHWAQIYESFNTEVGELLLCLNSTMLKKIAHLEPSRKALLASELIIMQYLDRVGGYIFKSANFTNLIDYCMTADL